MQFRRVVTGHDANGKAMVKSDEMVGTTPMREGVNAKVMWTTEGFPVDNSGDADESLRVTGTFHPNGTVFRLVEFLPGALPRNHRTDSIDYAVVVCHNPLLAERRARKREELLQATERELAKVAAMAERGAAGGRAGLKGAAAIGERVGRVVNKYQMAKHFARSITDASFSYARKEDAIAQEAALDGLYVLRTNVLAAQLDTAGVVLAYKSLAHVERAFRHFKLSDLEVRPIYHYTEPRVRAHLLLCMLAYLVQREMQQALAPLLFVDEAPPARPDPVAPAPRSTAALRKDHTQQTAQGEGPVHSFRTLLATLGTMVKNRVQAPGSGGRAAFDLLTQPTPLQQRAFDLLGLPVTGL